MDNESQIGNTVSNHTNVEIKVIELIHKNYKFLFDPDYYLEENPDIATIDIDPLLYHVSFGWKNIKVTSKEKGYFKRFLQVYRDNFFDEEYYLKNNPDIQNTEVEPFFHYVVKGYSQNRRPNSLQPADADQKLAQLLAFNYIHVPHYQQLYPQVKSSNIHPILHYLNYGVDQGLFPNFANACSLKKIELDNAVSGRQGLELQDGVADNLQDQVKNVYSEFKNKYVDNPDVVIKESDIFAIHPYILDNSYDELNKIYNMLEDDNSKYAFAGVILARMIDNNEVYQFVKAEYNEYEHPLVKPEKGDVLFDLGACNGGTSVRPLDITEGQAVVYSLEPGKTSYQRILKNLESYKYKDRIHLFNLGSWSKRDRLFFSDDDASPSSRIVNFETNFHIDVIDIDTLVRENNIENVSLIKMDVEASEMETLKGADHTIKKFKPKLQVCVYHKNYGDLIDLPNYIDRLNLGYKFYLGHHDTSFCETVLYAIAD